MEAQTNRGEKLWENIAEFFLSGNQAELSKEKFHKNWMRRDEEV